MMKFVKPLCILALGICMQSCVTTMTQLTDNPIGSKRGVTKSKLFSNKVDLSIASAVKNGNIKKIGTVEYRMTLYLIFPVYQTIVTGE